MKSAVWGFLYVLSVVAGSGGAEAQAPSGCTDNLAELDAMVQTEYAFARRAQSSVREAFLEYLAEDSVVFGPGPTPGRALYEAAKPNADKLEWYPPAAGVSGGLGFTTGPWVYTGPAGQPTYGHFVSIWRREGDCRWRVVFDGGISHPLPPTAEPKLLPSTPSQPTQLPPQKLISAGSIDQAIQSFERTAQQDGLAAGLRTYARDGDFRFYVDGAAPMDVGAASQWLASRSIGNWTENAHGRSADSTLAYVVGEFTDARKDSHHAFLQIWQYDAKVANWGLRIFLQNP